MHKVAQVIRRFVFAEWGGTENVVWNSAQALQAAGFRSHILATSALDHPGEEIRNNIVIRRFPYFYPYFPMPAAAKSALDKKGGSPYSWGLWRALLRGGYDLIHVHSGGRIAAIAAAAAAKLGIPCVFSLHGGYADIPAEEIAAMLAPVRRKIPYGGLLDRMLGLGGDPLKKMGLVICVGENEYDILSERYPDQHIVFLPNGIDNRKFAVRKFSPESVRRHFSVPAGRRLIVCVSRIDYQKNQKMLVKLIARPENDSAHLLLIGPETAPWYAAELRQLAQKLNVEKRITFAGALTADDPLLAAAMQAADVCILPSLHEPFGIVVLEAWAAGAPVIAAAVGGLRRLVQDEINGLLFASDNLEALAAAYQRLLANESLKARLTENAKAEVQKYSWKKIAGRLSEFYQDAIYNS